MLDRKHCSGCHDDYYNNEGNSINGICWMRTKGKLIMRKEVHINDMPPHKHRPKKLPNCYSKPKYVYLKTN